MQSTLFETKPVTNSAREFLPEGGWIEYYPAFLSRQSANDFLDAFKSRIDWQQDNIKMFGKTIPLPRLTAWYGVPGLDYTYSGISMNPKPWTRELSELLEKIEDKANAEFTSVLLNRYRDGSDSVSWHSDDEPELGEEPLIASISLGATRRFKLRSKESKKVHQSLDLVNGSLLLMGGKLQSKYEHCITKQKRVYHERINLTFRKIN